MTSLATPSKARSRSVPESIADIHSHLVYGVDDGARSRDETLRGIAALVRAGVRRILTTPHLDASLLARSGPFEAEHERVLRRWEETAGEAHARHPGLSLHIGREIMLDVFSANLLDPRVRLNGTRYVLVEFPLHGVPPRADKALGRIRERGLVPIVAHVERYYLLERRPRVLAAWREAGAVFQVNAGSFVGAYGGAAERRAWELLRRGWLDVAASDHHARGPVRIDEARQALVEAGATLQERLLFSTNPNRVIDGEPLERIPASPLGERSGWRKLLRWIRRGTRAE